MRAILLGSLQAVRKMYRATFIALGYVKMQSSPRGSPHSNWPTTRHRASGELESSGGLNELGGMQPGTKILAVAPMMDWTDRHCRFFHRGLTRRARLYTEMVTADAVIR